MHLSIVACAGAAQLTPVNGTASPAFVTLADLECCLGRLNSAIGIGKAAGRVLGSTAEIGGGSTRHADADAGAGWLVG